MFLNQPLASRLGNELSAELTSDKWDQLDIAVAWVRASGLKHLKPALQYFLSKGGTLSTIVGVDLQNTSIEGLRELLALQSSGAADSFVYHNESGTIFHPKIYLFRSATSARLIIGSNNITEAGLFRNTEASIVLNLSLSDPTLASILDALATWSDQSSGLSLRLSETLIASLESNGYVKSEAILQQDFAARSGVSERGAERLSRLFKSVPVTAPSTGADAKSPPKASSRSNQGGSKVHNNAKRPAASALSSAGSVLLMRVRKAHARDRPTQTQIPASVLKSDFFDGAMTVISAHSGQTHTVSVASARGGVNTLKLEIPEMRHMVDPVLRLEKTATGIQYEVYDAASPHGKSVMTTLRNGLSDGVSNPTSLTRPNNPASATWWRFI